MDGTSLFGQFFVNRLTGRMNQLCFPEKETQVFCCSGIAICCDMADLADMDNDTLELNVKTIDSTVYSLKGVQIRDRNVESLRELVKEATGVEKDRQRLIFRGKVLCDGQPLSEYKLEPNTMLHLISRPENFRELQVQAEAHVASSAPTASSRFFDRGTSTGTQNSGLEAEATDASAANNGSGRRAQVPDAQSESVEVSARPPSLNTLLSVTRGRVQCCATCASRG